MPGGRTHASVSRSYSHAAVRSPRLVLTAWCTGVMIWSRTNTTPTKLSGTARLSPRWTAPMSMPIAMPNTAGSTPRSRSSTHQAIAIGPAALGSTAKNVHSFRSRRRFSTGAFCPIPGCTDCRNLTCRVNSFE